MLLVATTSAGLAVAAEAWSHSREREKEAELLWIGNQFRQAIGLYYERAPDGVKRYPQALEDLLEDRRFLTPQRYLRKIYADPMSGKTQWDLVRDSGGGITGVQSPVKFEPVMTTDPRTGTALDWKFVYEPITLGAMPANGRASR